MRDLVVKVLQLFHLVMPKTNRFVLQTMLSFLTDVAQLSSQNKMDSLNLAKMMVPNLCRYEKEAPNKPEGDFFSFSFFEFVFFFVFSCSLFSLSTVLVSLHKRMAVLTKFCIDNHQEIFGIPDVIQAKLAAFDEKENTASTSSPMRGVRKFDDHEMSTSSPAKHKKIMELAGGDADTPRKRTKVDSPRKAAPSRLQQQQQHQPSPMKASPAKSPSRSPSKRVLRRGNSSYRAKGVLVVFFIIFFNAFFDLSALFFSRFRHHFRAVSFVHYCWWPLPKVRDGYFFFECWCC